MSVYGVIIIILSILTIISFMKPKAIIPLMLSAFILLIFASLKDVSVGTDSMNYYNYFMNVKELKHEIFYSGIQRGWYYFNLFFYYIGSYNIFLFICYTIVFTGLSIYIQRTSQNNILPILLFVLLYFYCSSLNVMRQYIALGVYLIALTYLDKDKVKYIIWVLVASLFHYSAIFCLVLLFHKYIKMSFLWVIIPICISFLFGLVMSDKVAPIINILSSLTDSIGLGDRTSGYLALWGGDKRNILTNLGINLMFIFTYLLARKDNNLPLKMYFLYVFCNNFFGALGQGNRLFLYVQIAMIICLTNTLYDIKSKPMKLIYFIGIITYAIMIWIYSSSGNSGEVMPYILR